MHREDYIAWAKEHPIVVACVVTAIVTSIFWIAVLR